MEDDSQSKKVKMKFSKKSTHKSKQQIFTLIKPDVVQEFTYLGVNLRSTGNFSTNLTQLKEKALHALFYLTRTVGFKKLKPKQVNRLSDVLITPILAYGCEVWGAYFKHNFEKWDKSPNEKVHLIFCSYYLGGGNTNCEAARRARQTYWPAV